MKTRVMTLAWEIKTINTKEFYGMITKKTTKLTWSECLRLAWKLIKSWSGKVGEIVRQEIEIFRENGAGNLRHTRNFGMRYTIK